MEKMKKKIFFLTFKVGWGRTKIYKGIKVLKIKGLNKKNSLLYF